MLTPRELHARCAHWWCSYDHLARKAARERRKMVRKCEADPGYAALLLSNRIYLPEVHGQSQSSK